MTETITIDGKDYEPLTLDRIGEITHARLAGGKVVGAKKCDPYIRVGVPQTSDNCHVYYSEELEDNNIQPLNLVERKPVSFVSFSTLEHTDRGDLMVICAPHEVKEGMKFKCVQIIEEASIIITKGVS